MSYSCFSDYYDIFTDNVDYSAMADYICALFDRYGCKPESVLDAACGTGSLAIELAKRDFDMVCSDSSCEMLSVAMEKAQGLGILFLNQAMENLDLYGTVGAAVCTLDSVNHITNEKKLAEAFFKVSLFTEPGGLFIFDVN
ncbi:MAG: class I SAM-dependent methyltransferase, partial [Clostridia bacterium]|nr:class I SAM-dependent methyltransferase [Clostridia bacterium]